MRIIVRADASRDLGTGHIMRCLTLLDALSVKAFFVCKRLEGHLGDLIAARGHQVRFIEPGLEKGQETAKLAENADLVIVDHYALDAAWEVQMPCPVMVIDDLADRSHECSILLDQNLGRQNSDYDGLVPASCLCLTGPEYALLRPEFSDARPAALASRAGRDGELTNLMIAMGGTDALDATGWVLGLLQKITLPDELKITVVLGTTAPHLEMVRVKLAELPCYGEFLVGTNRMADLMVEADLAIGGAGSTSWERCALGLPSLIVVLADNQKDGAKALVAEGAAKQVDLYEDLSFRTVVSQLMTQRSERQQLSLAAAALCDGGGASRVSQALVDILPSRGAS